MADRSKRGAIDWMTQHRVAPNLLMLILVLGGLFMSTRIKQAVFPEFEPNTVSAIDTFPGDAEQPRVSMRVWQRDVMDLVLYGDVSEHALRQAGEQLRDGLLQAPGVTAVELDGVESLSFAFDHGGPGGGASLSLRLSHRDTDTLRRASAALAQQLSGFASVAEVSDGYAEGKPQWSFKLTESARALGLSANDIASQVRNAFYGAEAFEQLRGRNEVAVRVWLGREGPASASDVAALMIRAPAGTYVPLAIPFRSYIQPAIIMIAIPFGGLTPMIFETSRQARFMIPMAISLGYGILFATAILLLLIPCLYLVVEDLKGLLAPAPREAPAVGGAEGA
jgi:multidrug efflux pump subunit AcrB